MEKRTTRVNPNLRFTRGKTEIDIRAKHVQRRPAKPSRAFGAPLAPAGTG